MKRLLLSVLATMSLWSEVYTPAKMQRMAEAAVAMSNGRAEGIKDVAAAFEYRGYVAAVLDNDKRFRDCRGHDLDVITGRSAAYAAMTSVDGNGSAAVSAYMAVTYACKALGAKLEF